MPLQLAELAIHIPSTISLFEKYELDYYQNGNQTLKEACAQKGLDFNSIDKELADLSKVQINNLTIEDMDLNLLIERINGQHHDHESEVLTDILTAIQNIVTGHHINIGQLKALKFLEKRFTYLKERLLAHCEKEDKVLFPMIRKVTALQKDKSPQLKSIIAEIKALVKALELEHAESIALISEIKNLLPDINKTELASNKYAILMTHFKDFELDFHIHIHIENNVLFPKIKEMDEQFKK